MTELARGELEHDWKEYDEKHKACARCGLRLFWTEGTAYGQRGWVLVNFHGVTSPPLLSASAGSFGDCVAPPLARFRETVIIEYTGDPDRHPSCERYMHRAPGGSSAALLDLRSLRPVCGWPCMWWELGPVREHVGWTWCGDCFPGKGPRCRDRPELEHARPRPPAPPALERPKPRQLKAKKRSK